MITDVRWTRGHTHCEILCDGATSPDDITQHIDRIPECRLYQSSMQHPPELWMLYGFLEGTTFWQFKFGKYYYEMMPAIPGPGNFSSDSSDDDDSDPRDFRRRERRAKRLRFTQHRPPIVALRGKGAGKRARAAPAGRPNASRSSLPAICHLLPVPLLDSGKDEDASKSAAVAVDSGKDKDASELNRPLADEGVEDVVPGETCGQTVSTLDINPLPIRTSLGRTSATSSADNALVVFLSVES